MKIKKKSPIIEAVQFLKISDMNKCRKFTGTASFIVNNNIDHIYIPSEGGTLTCSLGDWIIKDVDGNFYPCTNENFKLFYDKIDNNLKSFKSWISSLDHIERRNLTTERIWSVGHQKLNKLKERVQSLAHSLDELIGTLDGSDTDLIIDELIELSETMKGAS